MATRIVILSPLDLKPGTISPNGKVVASATIYAPGGAQSVVADVRFEDGTSEAVMWPSGIGWTVDGKVGA